MLEQGRSKPIAWVNQNISRDGFILLTYLSITAPGFENTLGISNKKSFSFFLFPSSFYYLVPLELTRSTAHNLVSRFSDIMSLHARFFFFFNRRIGLLIRDGLSKFMTSGVMPHQEVGSLPSTSYDLHFLPCDISLDFPFRCAERGVNVPDAKALGIHFYPYFFFTCSSPR